MFWLFLEVVVRWRLSFIQYFSSKMRGQKSNPKTTLFVTAIGMLIIYLKFRLDWILYLLVGVVLLGVISKRVRQMIDQVWMKMAYVLGLFMPKILLTIIFYGILFPIALLFKLFGKSDIILKNNRKSFFKEVNKSYTSVSFEKLW